MKLALLAMSVFAVAVAFVEVVIRAGRRVDGSRSQVPDNPFELFFGVLSGEQRWPQSGTEIAIGLGLLLLALVIAGLALARKVSHGRVDVDRASRLMASPRQFRPLTAKAQNAKAQRMGVSRAGLPIGRAVTNGQWLFSSWEDVSVDIWGPRTGKTVSRAIPAILEAPGAVIATSNKRDVVDATRSPRAGVGEVWVFDPQQLAEEPAGWWWNPLSYVTDETKAQNLASIFAAANTAPGARSDAFFEPEGRRLLGNLLLAAAVDERPITDVYLWLTNPTDETPVDLLDRADYAQIAASVRGVMNDPPEQRGGVYGTAKGVASFLTSRAATRWVTPQPGRARREFDPHAFVTGTGTLYSLSKEGEGTSGPLVTALTVAVCEAAEQLARRSPGGRLPVPMVAVLDEAANVCRWRELPNLYSHYGSRGICVLTILQSWSQGVEVWGRDGMRKLWSAANVRVFGGGVSEPDFLDEISRLIGDFDLPTRQISHSKGGRQVSHGIRRQRTLEVSHLGAVGQGRGILIASGVPPVLIKTVPWMEGPHAEEVRRSIRVHDPATAAPDAAEDVEAPVNPWVRGPRVGGGTA